MGLCDYLIERYKKFPPFFKTRFDSRKRSTKTSNTRLKLSVEIERKAG